MTGSPLRLVSKRSRTASITWVSGATLTTGVLITSETFTDLAFAQK
jgi:hypothetical protein